MRIFAPIFLCWLAMGLLGVSAQSAGSDPGELYFRGYMLKNEAEKLEQAGDLVTAQAKFEEARTLVDTVAKNFPQWQPEVVGYRLKAIEEAIALLARKTGSPVPAPVPVPVPEPAPAPAPAIDSPMTRPPAPSPRFTPSAPVIPAPSPGASSAMDSLNKEFSELQRQNVELAAKLKLYEDGYRSSLREREQAEQDRQLLERQLKDLKVKADDLAKKAAKSDEYDAELSKARNEVRMVSDLLGTTRKQLAETSTVLARLEKEKAGLLEAQKVLETELAAVKRDSVKSGDLKILMAENSRLKQELEVARLQVETMRADGSRKDQEILALKTQIISIQGELTKLRQENTAYQGQVADLTLQLKELDSQKKRPVDLPPGSTQDAVRLAGENEMLRNIIMRQLRQQERQRQAKELVIGEMKKMETASVSLMQNLEEMTAGKIFLTVSEEPLFTEPQIREILAYSGVNATLEASSAPSAPTKTTAAATPPKPQPAYDATEEEKLMVKAEQALLKGEFTVSAQYYQDVLRTNPKNTVALTSLAGIKLQNGKLEEAEVMLQKCLVYDPANMVALYRLGICYFQQNRLDEAFASFAKSVEKQNDNPRAHHYMGIIATKMGNRSKAEAEFKGALAIDPGYGDAHFNLAVLYATASPPNWELASQHYKSARDRGVKAEPSMEKLLKQSQSVKRS